MSAEAPRSPRGSHLRASWPSGLATRDRRGAFSPRPRRYPCRPPCGPGAVYAPSEGGASEALAVRTEIDFSGWYVIDEACAFLDGSRLFSLTRNASGRRSRAGEWSGRDGASLPGDHLVQFYLALDGASELHGSSRAAGYHFVVRSSHRFTVAPGSSFALTIAARERESTEPLPLEQRPIVSWSERQTR